MKVLPLVLLVGGFFSLVIAPPPVFAADPPARLVQPGGPFPSQSPIDILNPIKNQWVGKLDFSKYVNVTLKAISESMNKDGKQGTPINNDDNKLVVGGPDDGKLRPIHARHGHNQTTHLNPLGLTETDKQIDFSFPKGVADPIPTLKIGKDSYKLDHFHFHQYSEHTLGGGRFDMELHLVHKHVTKGTYLAVGRWIEITTDNNLVNQTLKPVFDALDDGVDALPADINGFVMKNLLPESYAHYRYDGSLTTGYPISPQAVNWVMFAEPLKLSQAHINAFRAHNSRGTVRHPWEVGEKSEPTNPLYTHSQSVYFVPEPSTALMVCCVLGMFAVRRFAR
jgi:carbonic anhydrase